MGRKISPNTPVITANQIINGYIDLVLREKRQNKIFPNIFIDRWECDLLEITKSGYVYEYEVKISRSDFKADARKRTYKQSKADAIKAGRTNYFYYVVPTDLIAIDEIPDYAGLIYVQSYQARFYSDEKGYYYAERFRFETVKQAPKLSSTKITESRLIKLLESTYYRFHKLRRGE